MTRHATPWLPDGALTDGRLRVRMQETVSAWASRWMVSPETDLSQREAGRAATDPDDHVVSLGSVYVRTALSCRLDLARVMLSATQEEQSTAPADRTLLEALSFRALDDLLETLVRSFPGADIKGKTARHLPAGDIPETALCFQLAVSGVARPVGILVCREAAIRARRSHLPPAVPDRPAGDWQDAVGRQTVRVGTLLGAGRLSLSDIASIESGDVIMLDQALGEVLQLAIDGRAAGNGACTIEKNQTRVNLRISSQNSGEM